MAILDKCCTHCTKLMVARPNGSIHDKCSTHCAIFMAVRTNGYT